MRIYKEHLSDEERPINSVIVYGIFSGVLTFVEYKVSQSSFITPQNAPENAVDNNDGTCAATEYGTDNYWRIHFNQTLTVKSVELRLKGGAC